MKSNTAMRSLGMSVLFLLAACAIPAGGGPQAAAPTATAQPTASATSEPVGLPVIVTAIPVTQPPTLTPHHDPPSVSITAPGANARVQGTVPVAATSGNSTTRVEFYVDGKLRFTDGTVPFGFNWDAFHERFGTHPSGVHTLRAVAYDASGASAASDVPVWVLPAPAGDCNSDGQVNAADLTAIETEVNDGDGTNTEDTPNGAFAGNPACDSNEDNLINGDDIDCAQQIIAQGAQACLDTGAPLVVPLIFVPKDLAAKVDQGVIDFVKYKVQEARRFYARANHGMTFRALPVEVVHGERNHPKYWVDGKNYEYGVLQELQARQYPVNVDWAQTPSNRVTWVLAFGSGGWAGARHYPTGSGFAMWGDALLFAAMDLNCDRVVDGIAGQGIADICQKQWLPSGNIYGFGIGGAIHELGHTFGLPHPPDGDPAWETSVMGGHWNYPNWSAPANGLADADRAILAGSHYFPGFADASYPSAVISSPADGALVSSTITISAAGKDNDGVSNMVLRIDGAPVDLPGLYAADDQMKFDYAWDTSGVAEGIHTLELTVTDTAGNNQVYLIHVTVQH